MIETIWKVDSLISGDLRKGTAETALGPLTVVTDREGRVVRVMFGNGEELTDAQEDSHAAELAGAIVKALGSKEVRLKVAIAPHVTEFQRDVLQAVAQIPRGTLATYGAIAAMAGHERGVRSVATSIGRNPVPLLIPCHRVVPSACADVSKLTATSRLLGNYTPRRELKGIILEKEGYFSGRKISFLRK